ncbi:hypothetical protein RZE82_02415 [Mollicutes bacterium LVI A0039]|nr:hypothetical protein RZE82_02415 [Mollicutes bacterium LVI A0039]
MESISSIPAHFFKEFADKWHKRILIVKEKSFAIEILDKKTIKLSDEHIEARWVKYEDALEILKWDSNKTALWELNERLREKK